MSGRAIAEGRLVVERRLTRDGFPSTVKGADVADRDDVGGRPDPARMTRSSAP